MARSLATILACLLLDTAANGATLCVNPGGTSGCFASLQGAVDASAPDDLITVAAGTYVENVLIDGRRLDIVGDDPATTLIDGGGTGRTITVRGPGTKLTLSRLGIQNAGPSIERAGLTVSTSKVTVERCRITGNAGPGLSDDEGAFGGIRRARLTVVETTIDGNAAAGLLLSAQSRATVERSTISNNGDSGIYIRGRGSRVTVQSSTISGNTTTTDGGGVYLVASTVKLWNSTVASNTAQGAGGGVYGVAARTRSEGTILADNLHMGATPNECASLPSDPGRFISRGYNLVENGCPFTGSTTLDITGQDPLLGPLQDNGGFTFTRVPGGGSPAIGAIDRERTCHNIDQFGSGRAPLPCDIGAVEAP